MEKGRYGSRQAAEFLASIYFDEKHDYAAALPILQRLRSAVPESLYYDFLIAAAAENTGDRDGSLQAARAAFEKIEADPASYQRKLLSLVCGSVGKDCLSQTMAASAGAWLDAAIEAEDARLAAEREPKRGRKARAEEAAARRATERILSLLHLYRGYMHDVLGNRDEAKPQYAWVASHPDFLDDRAQAEFCAEQPCGAPYLFQRMRALSKPESEAPSASVKGR